jgi:hypothetical protein
MTEHTHIIVNSDTTSPIDDIENFIITTSWHYERISSHELVVNIKGQYCEYHATIAWLEHSNILHIALSFSIGLSREPLPLAREHSILKLLSMMNESLQIGHFDLWRNENAIVWRYGHFLTDHNLSTDNLSKIFRTAIKICEQHYPAFQFVLWAGHTPADALHFVLLETVGEA